MYIIFEYFIHDKLLIYLLKIRVIYLNAFKIIYVGFNFHYQNVWIITEHNILIACILFPKLSFCPLYFTVDKIKQKFMVCIAFDSQSCAKHHESFFEYNEYHMII